MSDFDPKRFGTESERRVWRATTLHWCLGCHQQIEEHERHFVLHESYGMFWFHYECQPEKYRRPWEKRCPETK